jgi:deoxyribonuclease-4
LLKLGVHVSISGIKKLDKGEVKEFRRKVELFGFTPVVSHMPYLPNLSSPKKLIHNKSLKSLMAELDRCATLGIPYVVTHLGSHLGKGADVGLEQIVTAVNQALSKNESDVMLLLENTAGTKNSMGSSFEEIKRILDRIERKDRVGVCFDTAHGFAAGYDLRTAQGVNSTIERFDSTLQLNLLKVIHLNDSKGDLGSGRDRHEHIGLGSIGEEGFRALFHHDAVRDLPFIMETPIDTRRDDVGNIRKVRELSS